MWSKAKKAYSTLKTGRMSLLVYHENELSRGFTVEKGRKLWYNYKKE